MTKAPIGGLPLQLHVLRQRLRRQQGRVEALAALVEGEGLAMATAMAVAVVATAAGWTRRRVRRTNIGHSWYHYKQCIQHFKPVQTGRDATRAHGSDSYRNFSTLSECTWQWARDWSRTG